MVPGLIVYRVAGAGGYTALWPCQHMQGQLCSWGHGGTDVQEPLWCVGAAHAVPSAQQRCCKRSDEDLLLLPLLPLLLLLLLLELSLLLLQL